VQNDTAIIDPAEDQMSMPEVRKFLFDRSFDPEVAEVAEIEEKPTEEPEEAQAPTFSEEEMQAARDESFAAGMEEGVRKAAEATEHQIQETLKAVDGRIGELFAAEERAHTEVMDNAIAVAVGITRKIFPTLHERHGLEEIERMVVMAVERILDDPKIVIYVNGDLAAALEERVAGLATEAGFKGEIEIVAAEGLPAGDCRVEWTGGGAVRDLGELWQEIDEIVERNLAGTAESAEETTPEESAESVKAPIEASVDDPVDGAAEESATKDTLEPVSEVVEEDIEDAVEEIAGAPAPEIPPKSPEPEDPPPVEGAEGTTTDPEDT